MRSFSQSEWSLKKQLCFHLKPSWWRYFFTVFIVMTFFDFVIILPVLSEKMSSNYYESLSEFQKKLPINRQLLSLKYTPFWAAAVDGGEDVAKELAQKFGFVYLYEIMEGIYYFKHRRVSRRSTHHNIFHQNQLYFDRNVRWVEQQVVRRRVKRDVQMPMNDPNWPQMWYLNRGGPGGIDMNVKKVWARGYTGKGVVVTILDDGLETDHPDLKPNYDKYASFDVNSNDENPDPRYVESDFRNINRHGTRCAGEVAAAANNSICGLGIAYMAQIGGVRMLDGDVTDAMESRSLSHHLQHIDIYSASWGPEDDGRTVDGPGRLARLAFRNGIQKGRGGLGSIFVWASGNGGKYSDNCNCDGYTNSIYTLGVSSASEHGTIPWYAETCSSTLAVTYSSGGQGEKGVVTTDLNHTCTDSHSGTSASAPLAAGICALTLSANPRLTWRDLQYIVIYSARPDGLYTNDWRVNGVGRRVSHAFGYGLMDAAAMVDLALNWTTVPTQRLCEMRAPLPRSPLTMRHHASERLTLTTDGCLTNQLGDSSRGVFYLEHVQAKVTLTSDRRGEVELWLTSPMGTVSKLLSKRPFDLDVAGFHAWPFMSVHYWGEMANGTWILTVHSGNAVVSLHSWSLNIYGVSEKPPHKSSSNQPANRENLRDTHPIASLLDEHLAPLNQLPFSFNPEQSPLLPPIQHYQKEEEAMILSHGDYAVEFDSQKPPFQPFPYGDIPPDPLWDEYNQKSQNWFQQGENLRPIYRGQFADYALGKNGVVGAPKRANGYAIPSHNQHNSLSGSYPSLGYALALGERPNTPRKSPWQRMDMTKSVAKVTTSNQAFLANFPGFIFYIYFFLLYFLS